jgi:hypothetical protein
MKRSRVPRRGSWPFVCHPCRLAASILLVFALLLAGCTVSTPQPELQRSPLATPRGSTGLSVLPTATMAHEASPTPPPVSPSPLVPTAFATTLPSRLVVLHTNDNWGETEPCG